MFSWLAFFAQLAVLWHGLSLIGRFSQGVFDVEAEIGDEFGPWLQQLQFVGDGERHGSVFQCWGIVYVPNPYAPGRM